MHLSNLKYRYFVLADNIEIGNIGCIVSAVSDQYYMVYDTLGASKSNTIYANIYRYLGRYLKLNVYLCFNLILDYSTNVSFSS